MNSAPAPNLFNQLILFLAAIFCGVLGCPVPV
ncbi:hypothetical protein DFR68_103297 [Nocardia mexicana]|uniref:Uncharacterized protein n=1 Tax=Nocardia mexicana TaxID=279262 RepID=A0A370H9J7_9NOCA|nr:hypothetical protein DFR68_103297 [Nocardia mexicana]